MMLLNNLISVVSVSSVLNHDHKQYGKKFLFDNNEDTCWNSDKGNTQHICIKFEKPVIITDIAIQFQGGFSCQQCDIHRNSIVSSLYPEDVNFIQRDVTLDYDVYEASTCNLDPLIISHGLFGSKKNWRSLCKRINELTDRKVVAFDSVNHGSSSHHPEMSYEAMAYDLVTLTKKLDIKSSILVGHSMGGKLSMVAALLNPVQFSKLVVVDVAPTMTKSLEEVLKYMHAMKSIDLLSMKKRKDIEDELEKVVEARPVRQFLMGNLDFSQGQFTWKCNLTALIQNYSFIKLFPKFDDDIIYSKPTLFIGGSLSHYITDEDYPEIKKRFPNASIVHIPDAGHWVHSDKPNEFLKILTEFIK